MWCGMSGPLWSEIVDLKGASFSVRILVWNASQLNNVIPMEDDGTSEVEKQRELESLKDDLISKGHVHSFTYDFHLRMVATYLVGGQQVRLVGNNSLIET